nr:hypothetical protein [Tanacetum cinerariifolium]
MKDVRVGSVRSHGFVGSQLKSKKRVLSLPLAVDNNFYDLVIMSDKRKFRVFHYEWNTWNVRFLRYSCSCDYFHFNYFRKELPNNHACSVAKPADEVDVPGKHAHHLCVDYICGVIFGADNFFFCKSLVVGCKSVWSSYMICINFANLISSSGIWYFMGISIQDVLSGSDSSGTPTVPSLTFNNQFANVDTSFSASDKFPKVSRIFSVRRNSLKERHSVEVRDDREWETTLKEAIYFLDKLLLYDHQERPATKDTTTLTAFPSDNLRLSPATCRCGSLSPATCRWGTVAGERS